MPSTPQPLRLHVPEPTGRPGHGTDFSYLHLSPAGAVRRPPVDVSPADTGDLPSRWCACSTTRAGPSAPGRRRSTRTLLRRGLRAMMKTRAFDAAC